MSILALHARLRCLKLLVRWFAPLRAALASCAAVFRGKRIQEAAALLRATPDGGDQRLTSTPPGSATLHKR